MVNLYGVNTVLQIIGKGIEFIFVNANKLQHHVHLTNKNTSEYHLIISQLENLLMCEKKKSGWMINSADLIRRKYNS